MKTTALKKIDPMAERIIKLEQRVTALEQKRGERGETGERGESGTAGAPGKKGDTGERGSRGSGFWGGE